VISYDPDNETCKECPYSYWCRVADCVSDYCPRQTGPGGKEAEK
jgi:hypothetical protein